MFCQPVDIAYTEDHFQIVFLAGCRSKFHREHISGSGQGVAPCKVSFDPTSAKEMLLMAASLEDQQPGGGHAAKYVSDEDELLLEDDTQRIKLREILMSLWKKYLLSCF